MSKRAKENRVITATLVACAVWVVAGTVVAEPPKMEIDPIAGLTTSRHVAPENMTLPPGTVLQLRQPRSSEGPSPSDPAPKRIIDDDDSPEEGVIVWSGVDVSFDGVDASIARRTLNLLGEHIVTARLVDTDGNTLWENRTTVNVVDVPFSSIEVEPQEAAVAAMATDVILTNEDTMRLFFSLESIADLHWITDRRSRDSITSDTPGTGSPKGGTGVTTGRYITSNRRTVSFGINVTPPDCSSLMEWRVDGKAVGLGLSLDHRFDSVGVHTLSVGPPDRAQVILVETYNVTITSHTGGVDIVPEGEPVTFEAVTDPPGHEDYITWLASTKYGTGTPILGYGSTFTVLFEDTFGDDPINGLWQWLGVKADSTTLGQDQKPLDLGCCDPGACCVAGECGESGNLLDCLDQGGQFLGEGTTCDVDVCIAVNKCKATTAGPFVPAGGCPGPCHAGGATFCSNDTCPQPLVCPAGATTIVYDCPNNNPGTCRAGGVWGGCVACP